MNSLVSNEAKSCRSCGAELRADECGTRCEQCTALEQILALHLAPAAFVDSVQSLPPTDAEGAGFGDYVLLNEIGRGGMGTVHRARQRSLNRIVALKRPLAGLAVDPERVRRFKTEAEAVAALSHPNIIPVFEFGEHNGEHYFSMAYVEGRTLSEVASDRVSPLVAAGYVRKIADAIHHAHQRGVLHRDLKPDNIIVDVSNEPRVADFGIACLLHEEGLREEELEESRIGTPNFMAPEQVHPGQKQLSVATDVYALGGILYQLLTGRPPFVAETREKLYWQVFYDEPEPPGRVNPETPPDLEAICLKALEKSPASRYVSARDLAEDLQRYEQGRPVNARKVSVTVKAWMWARRNREVAVLLVILSVAIVGGFAAQRARLQEVREARADSEGFIGFMNQDLANDLKDVGRLDLMEKINERAANYYASHAALGDSRFLERKARFLENAAKVQKELGDLAGAETRAVEAEEICQKQSEIEPTSPVWKRNQSRVRVLRQNIAKESGLRLVAREHAEVAVAAANAALTMDRSDPTNKAALAQALMEQASLWLKQGQHEAPGTNLVRAEALLKDVIQLPTADPEWSQWLANGAYYRAQLSQLRKESGQALSEFEDYLGQMQELAARYPRNGRWRYELAIANSHVAAGLILQGQNVQAQTYLDAFENQARNLTTLDSRNKVWLCLYGKSLALQGENARQLRSPSALQYLAGALTIQSNLVQQNPSWDLWADNAAETTRSLVGLHAREGRTNQARALSADWVRQCELRALANPYHVGHQLRWGDAIIADIRLQRLTTDVQVVRLRESLQRFDAVPPTRPAVLAKARVLAGLAEAYEKSNDLTNASTYLQQALDVRLSYFELMPVLAKLREQIPDNFKWLVRYYLGANKVEDAITAAERALMWASKNLEAGEYRAEFFEICRRISEVTLTPEQRTRAKEVIRRSLTERFAEPPALTKDEKSQAGVLHDWFEQ